MAGNYSDIDLAAIAVGFNIWLPLYLVILGTLFACSAIVAQDYGAGNIARVRSFLPQGLWVRHGVERGHDAAMPEYWLCYSHAGLSR